MGSERQSAFSKRRCWTGVTAWRSASGRGQSPVQATFTCRLRRGQSTTPKSKMPLTTLCYLGQTPIRPQIAMAILLRRATALVAARKPRAMRACLNTSKSRQDARRKAEAEANKARSKAAEGNENAAKSKPKSENSAPTKSGETVLQAQKPNNSKSPGVDAKASAANVDRGTVERIEWLERQRPDLFQMVKSGDLTSRKAHVTPPLVGALNRSPRTRARA